MEAVPVVSTAFGICEMHKVKAEDGTVKKRVCMCLCICRWMGRSWHTHTHTHTSTFEHTHTHIHTQVLDGWLWFDEKDQINVIARLKDGDETKQEGAGKFLVFEQKKYGYEGLRYVYVCVCVCK